MRTFGNAGGRAPSEGNGEGGDRRPSPTPALEELEAESRAPADVVPAPAEVVDPDPESGPGAAAQVNTRVTELLGVEHPIIQAPMGYIARAQLASAVSNAGAHGHHRDVVGPARRRCATRSRRCATSPTSRSA